MSFKVTSCSSRFKKPSLYHTISFAEPIQSDTQYSCGASSDFPTESRSDCSEASKQSCNCSAAEQSSEGSLSDCSEKSSNESCAKANNSNFSSSKYSCGSCAPSAGCGCDEAEVSSGSCELSKSSLRSCKSKRSTSKCSSSSQSAANGSKSKSSRSCKNSRKSKFSQKLSDVDEVSELERELECPNENCDEDCNEGFTLSGSKPSKTVGALNKCFDSFAKYAPCGHWQSCKQSSCDAKVLFNPCQTSGVRAPFGPYGPWSKGGPAQFCTPKEAFLKQLFPIRRGKRNGLLCKPKEPMGKLAPWPLSGSCRYAGRPYGPCRPFGAYKSRGPFGYWTNKSWPEFLRPCTPAQPCWDPAKSGRRPCTPCHRPLFRPCKPCVPCYPIPEAD